MFTIKFNTIDCIIADIKINKLKNGKKNGKYN